MIRNVVLEVLDLNLKTRLLEEARSRPPAQEPAHGSSLLQGEAELAYLTHEGLFISDALNEVQDRSSRGSGTQQSQVEAAGSASESRVSREQSFMYVSWVCSSCRRSATPVLVPSGRTKH